MISKYEVSRRALLKSSLSGAMLLPLGTVQKLEGDERANPDTLPFRHIHLDFHTSPAITGVGEDFKAADFAGVLKSASINSITVFAKCHHGMAYYPTRVGVKHPNLKIDLLGEMIEACHREGIRVPVYISTMYDQHAWREHGEWRALNPDGSEEGLRGSAGPLEPGLGRVCVNTPYMDYLNAMAEEVLTRYETDGIFYDNFVYGSSGCCCAFCVRDREKLGLDSLKEEDRLKHMYMVMERVMHRLADTARAKCPKGTVFINGPLHLRQQPDFLRAVVQDYTHVEIESLPGGNWGYSYFPMAARQLRNLGLDTMGMTGAFHRSWGDFGSVRNQTALDYESFTMLAQATKCAIGDHLHPTGRLNQAVYARIGQTYRSVAEKEPWCRGARAVTEIGALVTYHAPQAADSDLGVANMLTQLREQFDLLDPTADFTPYQVLILPDSHRLSESMQKKIAQYLAGGGKLILSHESCLAADGDRFVLPVGAEYVSPWKHEVQYLKLLDPADGGFANMVEIAYEKGSAVKALPGASVWARSWRAYFDKSYEHFQVEQTPYSEPTEYAAVVATPNILYFAFPIFSCYARYAYVFYRKLVERGLRQFLPNPLLRTTGPTTLEATVTKQPERHIVHLLHYVPERRAPNVDVVEDVLPLQNVKISLRMAEKPSHVYLAPQRQQLAAEYRDGYVNTIVPTLNGHQMVAFDRA